MSNVFRCDYCGQFISLCALQEGITAIRLFRHEYDWMREDVIERYDTYHKDCKEGVNNASTR